MTLTHLFFMIFAIAITITLALTMKGYVRSYLTVGFMSGAMMHALIVVLIHQTTGFVPPKPLFIGTQVISTIIAYILAKKVDYKQNRVLK